MAMQRGNALLLGAVIAITVAGAIGYRYLPGSIAAVDDGRTRARIEDVEARTLAGEQVTLRELRGKVVLVNFWATWCGTCRSEMPGFQKVYDEFKDQDFEILAFSIDETGPATVETFLRENGYSFPVAMATEEARQSFGVTGVPVSFLLDQRGEIQQTVMGAFHEADLRTAVQTLLAEGHAGAGG
jgi:thiol-disulfide isomerase/thioredoxin